MISLPAGLSLHVAKLAACIVTGETMKFGIEVVYERLVELGRGRPCLYDATMAEHSYFSVQLKVFYEVLKSYIFFFFFDDVMHRKSMSSLAKHESAFYSKTTKVSSRSDSSKCATPIAFWKQPFWLCAKCRLRA